MSRIGKKPIEIPAGVTVNVDGARVTAKGPKGELALALMDEVEAKLEGNVLVVTPRDDSKRSHAMWGMQRTLVANIIEGVSKGFEKRLEITGVGFRAQARGRTLNLQLGYSHDIEYAVPEGVTVETPEQTKIVVSGIDKQKVGQVAAEIRAYRKPEPYKGKGVKYAGEYIFRKEGKKK
ncbi:MAG: 50S ribosomal protein L6 [Alphaproteobacteria bacterium]|nr:MAG: 50S ribosomal protein L6 [Alphaproteobacteria bacterium]